MNHKDKLHPQTARLIEDFRKLSLAYLNTKVCSVCATDIYLKVLASGMVAAFRTICEAAGENANPDELVQYLEQAWNATEETMQ